MDADSGETINSVSFNQDSGCFVVSTSEGIRVFNTDEFQSTFYRNFKGGIKFATMLYRTNIISFVGTGENPSFPSSRLVLWDDIAHRPFGELNFKGDVLATQLRKDKIVVVHMNKVYVYNFEQLDCSDTFITCDNPDGIVSFSTAEESCVLAIPDEVVGHVKIIHFSKDKHIVQIKCQNSALSCLKLSKDGKLLATTSSKGTLVRIWDTWTGEQLNELRRGADQAVISDISFDPDNNVVACASDKGTIHLFNMNQEGNKKSSLSALSGVVSYFGSKWSASQMKIGDTYSKCALNNGKIFAISTTGNYFMGQIGEGTIKVDKQFDLLAESKKVEESED